MGREYIREYFIGLNIGDIKFYSKSLPPASAANLVLTIRDRGYDANLYIRYGRDKSGKLRKISDSGLEKLSREDMGGEGGGTGTG